MVGLPVRGTHVCVGPPLSCKGPNCGSTFWSPTAESPQEPSASRLCPSLIAGFWQLSPEAEIKAEFRIVTALLPKRAAPEPEAALPTNVELVIVVGALVARAEDSFPEKV